MPKMKGYAKRGGGKVGKMAKSSGGGGSASGDSHTPGASGAMPSSYADFGSGGNASVRETRLPYGGCPKNAKTPSFKKRMKEVY